MNNILILGSIGAAILSLYLIHKNQHRDIEYMGLGAIGLELLGVVLSVFWAVTVMQSTLLSLFFVGGWIAMVAIRASVLPRLVSNYQANEWQRATNWHS